MRSEVGIVHLVSSGRGRRELYETRRKLEIQLPSWTQLRPNEILIPVQRRHEARDNHPTTCGDLLRGPLLLLYRNWVGFAVHLDIVMKQNRSNELFGPIHVLPGGYAASDEFTERIECVLIADRDAER